MGRIRLFPLLFQNVAPRALAFRPLVKGNEDSGNEIGEAWENVRGNVCVTKLHLVVVLLLIIIILGLHVTSSFSKIQN